MTGLSNATGLSATSSSLILTAKGMAGSAGLSSGIGLGGGIATLVYDFSTGVLPPSVTFTRASTAWGFNSAGVLTAYATDQPRMVYDPVTLQSLGLLVEAARTNSVRNNTMVGAAAGTPGTVPTNWITTFGVSNIVRTIVGTGIEDGIEYIDMQLVGTPNATNTGATVVQPEAHTQAAAASAQIWIGSYYVRLVAGSLAGLTGGVVTLNMVERDSGGSGTAVGTTSITPTSAALRTQRYSQTRTLTGGTTAFLNTSLTIGFTNALPIDITLRIGLPQLEKNDLSGVTAALGGPSSPIKTSTVAVARAVDVAKAPAPYKTVILRARTPSADPIGAISQPPFGISDNTFINMMTALRISPASFQASCTTSFSIQCTLEVGASSINADFGMAVRFENNNFGASLNGGPVVTDLVGTIPPTANVLSFGVASAATNNMWFSTIKSIELRSMASDAELQTLSVP